jgi:DNA-binding transcriptional ArsR family regulator
MPRAPATTDIFSAVAEPRRRQIIDFLATGTSHPVTDVVDALRIPQPAVSKHLGVLREVGIVSVERRGRERLYRLNPQELKPMYDWTRTFERYWLHQLDRVKQRAEQTARQSARHHRKEKNP